MRISGWSSDGCSSDLNAELSPVPWIRLSDLMRESMGGLSGQPVAEGATAPESLRPMDRIMGRHSGKRTDRQRGLEGQSVSVRVDLGGVRILKHTTLRSPVGISRVEPIQAAMII